MASLVTGSQGPQVGREEKTGWLVGSRILRHSVGFREKSANCILWLGHLPDPSSCGHRGMLSRKEKGTPLTFSTSTTPQAPTVFGL